MDLKSKLRHVMDFPKEGIDFIDITTVLQDKEAFKQVIDEMVEISKSFGDFDIIAAAESRGFIFGSVLAYELGKGFVPIRKKGKLPYDTVSYSYELEYGVDTLEMHVDAVKPAQKVLIVDDLLATGGTANSNIELVEKLKGDVVGLLYFIELTFLKGREKLKDRKVETIVKF